VAASPEGTASGAAHTVAADIDVAAPLPDSSPGDEAELEEADIPADMARTVEAADMVAWEDKAVDRLAGAIASY
jgi:hypothetical protein